MLLTLILAFLEGFALIISPCILPILPIILSGALTGNKRHPMGIIVGFVSVFALFTLFSRELVQLLRIDVNVLREVSFILLLLLGIILLSTHLTERFNRLFSRLANVGAQVSFLNNTEGGFYSGFFFGSLVGLVWTPCAGPILAAVIVQSIIQTTTWQSFLTVLLFGIGAAVPMLMIALLGRKFIAKMDFFRNHATLLRKLLGLIIILTVMYLFVSQSMQLSFAQSEKKTTVEPILPTTLIKGLAHPYPAPIISGITDWINTPALTMQDMADKVILVDFWAYSCINCIHTMPYLNDWYEKYHDQGLMIIGVHSPEFDFEKKLDNVRHAVEKNQIKYPVALDNHFVTWQNFHNSAWPAHYLIDKKGQVVYEQFGEGDYDITENNIRYLLGLGTNQTIPAVTNPPLISAQTPETYLGYARADSFAMPMQLIQNHATTYQYPSTLALNMWALQGDWQVGSEKITATQAGASIKIHFQAKKIFAVMGSASQQPLTINILQEGVLQKKITVSNHTLYPLLALPDPMQSTLELTSEAPGLEMYTFVFGD